jgi:hypothetical protein
MDHETNEHRIDEHGADPKRSPTERLSCWT